MAEEEHYGQMSDLVENTDTETFMDSGQQNLETDLIENKQLTEDLETLNTEETPSSDVRPPNQSNKPEVIRSTRLPMGRIKNIIKMDPDVNVVSSDAVFLVTKATELFLENIAQETYSYTSTNKRKVISKRDLDLIINKVDCLCFLEGAMDF